MSEVVSPLFVVGVPRSGTTVFSVKLAEATGIAIAPETHFMPEVYAGLKELDLSSDEALDRVITKFQSGRWFGDLSLDPEQIKESFRGAKERGWADLFSTVLQLHARKIGASGWGEKTPGHYLYVETLLDWYSGCRILFVLRDPRAVVASNMRAPFAPSYAWFAARRCEQVWNIYQSVADDPRVLMIRYEDFVADANDVLARLTQTLGISEGDLSPLLHGAAADKGKQGWRLQHLQAANGAVNTQSLEKWREQLSPYEIWVSEHYTRRFLSKCGYSAATPSWRGWLHRLYHICCFPKQRVALSIEAAARAVQNGKALTAKHKILLLLGSLLDGVALLVSPRNEKVGNYRGKHAVITLGSRHRGDSSFFPLTREEEAFGVFVTELCDLGYQVCLLARRREQYFVAKKLIKAFSVGTSATAIYSRDSDINSYDRIETYWVAQEAPMFISDDFQIAVNARATAREIDKVSALQFSRLKALNT